MLRALPSSLINEYNFVYCFMELVQHPTLADSICDLCTRKIKKPFFTQLDILIDWMPIEVLIKQYLKVI